jgi:uncharacterized protein YecA (UPF0149 family)
MQKIGPNDPCWCGSREKYKKCHRNRQSESPLPFGALAQRTFKESKLEHCLHPSAALGVCDKIVSAHTIQRSRVLDRIVDSKNHVCSLLFEEYGLFS